MFFKTIAALFLACAPLASHAASSSRANDKVIHLNLMSEVASLDPGKQLDSLSAFWLGHMYEGLATYDQFNKVVLAQARSVDVSKNGLTYTFKLRNDARWHDGKPVVASDYVFAWQRLVDPVYASSYSFIAESAQIKNASNIIAKKMPAAELGVKAIDAQTLVVELENPVPSFLSLMALNPFFPVRRDVVDQFKDKFGLDEKSVVGNGPFKLKEWKMEQSMSMIKASTYWNQKNIQINQIAMPTLVKDARSSYTLYETGGLDFIDQLDSESLGLAQKKKFKVLTAQSGVVWYMILNMKEGRFFSSSNMRHALDTGLNKAEYINRILGLPGRKVANGFVPPVISDYRKIYPFKTTKYDLKKSQALVKLEPSAEIKKIQSIDLLAPAVMGTEVQNYFQQEIGKVFGVQVKPQAAPFKIRQQKIRDGDFDIAFASWIPDYDDPMTYLDIFMSDSSANSSSYKNESYDELIKQARALPDLKKRYEKLFAAENVLLNDAVIIPVEFSARAYLVQPRLKGALRRVFGPDPDFRFASYTK